jgi:hypothetical protein
MPEGYRRRDSTPSSISDDAGPRPARWDGDMTDTPIDEMGPIDYVVLEWRGREPADEVAPLILDVVDRGIIRILDVVFLTKYEDGNTSRLEITELGNGHAAFVEFEGASSGLLDADDIDEAASALEPGTSAAVLVWENAWAGPIATALRRSGGQLVASGRIPVQAILASLDATESPSTTGV